MRGIENFLRALQRICGGSLRFAGNSFMACERRPCSRCVGILTIGYEAGAIHSAPRLCVLHERLPDEPGSCVLSHEHCNSGIDADHIRVIPFLEWIERIDETIAA